MVLHTSERRVLLQGITWETYSRLVDECDECSGTRINYDRGTLEIMSPSFKHERLKEIIHRLFQLLADELGIGFCGAGSTTFRRRDTETGFEPDTCFYVQHASAVRRKTEIDLISDPPPDLVVEIDVSRSSLNKLAIFASVGVPEVWRYSGDALKVLRLDGKSYVESDESISLPKITSIQLTEFIHSAERMDEREWMLEVRRFARS